MAEGGAHEGMEEVKCVILHTEEDAAFERLDVAYCRHLVCDYL